MERRRKYMAYFLVAVSILVLMVAVFPHHHHGQMLCLTEHCEMCMDEIGTCSHHCHHDRECEHSCTSTCLTQLHYLNPDFHHENPSDQVSFILLLPLLSELVLHLPVNDSPEIETYYLEKLHAQHLNASIGLRAPPAMVLS